MDYHAQEIAVGAIRSGDQALLDAYLSYDVYLAFARECGLLRDTDDAETARRARKEAKAVVFGTQYGLTEYGLAKKLDISLAQAKILLELHRGTYPQFHEWAENIMEHAFVDGSLSTCFGWVRHYPSYDDEPINLRSARNHVIQGDSAEMLRLAARIAQHQGITLCAPLHDALLIESDMGDINRAVSITKKAMQDASAIVLDGFRITVDTEVYAYPNRFYDKDGLQMWNLVWSLVGQQTAPTRAGKEWAESVIFSPSAAP